MKRQSIYMNLSDLLEINYLLYLERYPKKIEYVKRAMAIMEIRILIMKQRQLKKRNMV